MARAKNAGNGRLEEAMALLLQNQASFVQTQAAFVARMSEIDQRMAESDRQDRELKQEIAERFARIETILLEHSRILEMLPDAIQRKFGFHPPEPLASAE